MSMKPDYSIDKHNKQQFVRSILGKLGKETEASGTWKDEIRYKLKGGENQNVRRKNAEDDNS